VEHVRISELNSGDSLVCIEFAAFGNIGGGHE